MSGSAVGANLAQAIGATVLELAHQRGWDVKELSERAGIRSTQLGRMISGDNPFNTDHLVKLARALDEPVSKLLSGLVGDLEPPEAFVDFEQVVREAHREGWAMARG